LLKQEASITVYRLPTKEKTNFRLPFYVCDKQTEVCSFRFPPNILKRQHGFKRKTEAQTIFLNPFALIVQTEVCPFV
jgi:hypothetical protein